MVLAAHPWIRLVCEWMCEWMREEKNPRITIFMTFDKSLSSGGDVHCTMFIWIDVRLNWQKCVVSCTLYTLCTLDTQKDWSFHSGYFNDLLIPQPVFSFEWRYKLLAIFFRKGFNPIISLIQVVYSFISSNKRKPWICSYCFGFFRRN